MKAAFADYPEAIENTVKIAEQCNVEIPHGKLILPKVDLPPGKTFRRALRDLVYQKKTV
jgi:DNA polymerase-3 subunit alpha